MLYTVYLLAVCSWGLLQIHATKDREYTAAAYALYIVGSEVIYRMGGATISWELGKYLCIILLGSGIIFRGRSLNQIAPFLLYAALLFPGILLADHPSIGRLREMIVFNLLGPITLAVAGGYFYMQAIEKTRFWQLMRIAALPSITLLTAMSLRVSLSEIDYTTLESNHAAAGGFGANQVSTVIGWFIAIFLLALIHKQRITPWLLLDLGLVGFLTLRGLLTYSRGGMLAVVVAFAFALTAQFLINGISQQMLRIIRYSMIGLVTIGGVIFYANSMTNNMLLYRYMGKDTSEVLTGREQDSSLLTGREDLMANELEIFLEYPLLGVGVGMMGETQRRFESVAKAAHTEFTRLLSEHGSLGLLAILLTFICLPLLHLPLSIRYDTLICFIVVLLISLQTMFHAAMRLALPGVLLGLAFTLFRPEKTNSKVIPRQPKA